MLLYFSIVSTTLTEIISFSIPAELRKKIDMIRGDVPRSKYIVSLLEAAVSKGLNMNSSSAGGVPRLQTSRRS
jgi:hypothetical protein